MENTPLTGINVNIFYANTGKYLTSQKFTYRNKQISNTPISLPSSGEPPNHKVKIKNHFSPLEEVDTVLKKPPTVQIKLLIIKIILIMKYITLHYQQTPQTLFTQHISPPPLSTYHLHAIS